jgi:hypothetical protein
LNTTLRKETPVGAVNRIKKETERDNECDKWKEKNIERETRVKEKEQEKN